MKALHRGVAPIAEYPKYKNPTVAAIGTEAYSPNIGEEEFSEVRGELIWQALLFWDFHGNDLRLRNYQRTLVAYIIEEDSLLGGSNKLKVWLSYLSCGA
jgi:hypothetical protein